MVALIGVVQVMGRVDSAIEDVLVAGLTIVGDGTNWCVIVDDNSIMYKALLRYALGTVLLVLTQLVWMFYLHVSLKYYLTVMSVAHCLQCL